jgi:cellulose synthase/poly-beta-1,6-N-acetylglucosamine synthase-like glycosyltransferase/peptidoglycan/xylan/chitin deacetylase (PgdA/CDA1 family)/spore germination protein YaaH
MVAPSYPSALGGKIGKMSREPTPIDRREAGQASSEGAESFVFLDRLGKRWPRFKRYSFLVGGLVVLGMVIFIQTLWVPSSLSLPPAAEQLKSRLQAQPPAGQARREEAKPLWLDFARENRGRGLVATGSRPAGDIRLGYFEGWDPASLASLKAHADQLTHLAPDWLSLEDGQGGIKLTQSAEVLELAGEAGLALIPQLRNLDANEVWQPEAVETLLTGSVAQQELLAANLVVALQEIGAAGVLIDWQQIDPHYRGALTALLARVAAVLHAHELELWLSVPARRQLVLLDLESLTAHVDRFVAALYDENAELNPPGPVASQAFFDGWLGTLTQGYGTPAQWVIGIGAYGYDWRAGDEEASLISFEDAMARAGRSAQKGLAFDPSTLNPRFRYQDQDAVHNIWFLDAITFLNQLTASRASQAGGIAIFRLGTEDPDIWPVLALDPAKPLAPLELAQLETISPGDAMAHVGTGSLITIDDQRADGFRRVTFDQNRLASARYEKFPTYLTLVHEGAGPRDAVAITFDDGPDPEWTPVLLDILKEEGVSATFFLIGANMEKHPELVQRIVREGHLIGNHTYTHPNIAEVSEERARLELNATQRLIESITGQSTILFRPPYNADTNPHTVEELVPIGIAQRMGYLTVTMDIDPEDWARPGVETMLERVRMGRRDGGSIVLLHDAGGDRTQTLEVLPEIIHYLRARGETILPLAEILKIPAAQLMPPVPANQQPIIRMISDGGFEIIHAVSNFLWALLILATALTLLKTLLVMGLALRNRRAERLARAAADWPPLECQPPVCPPVSVLVAAYNEAKVIRQTLKTLLATSYPGPMEVIVVDDGSQDGTGDIVAAMARDDDRVRLIRQFNLGKARALIRGLQEVRHGIVVSLDADTQFESGTITELVRPFADPRVGAVSGRARVGNLATLFARFQALEYSCGFNLDRRAYDQLNCITVVPGAVSAFRLDAIRAAGGISTDTLAEDTDLTLSLHRQGYRIRYASQAVAWTEAPETPRTFARQRFRWAFGTLQCLWKHRDLLFALRHGALGWFSLPNAWFFNFVLVAIGLLVDLVLLAALVLNPTNLLLYIYFFTFIASDMLLAAVAYWIERESLRQVWLILPMRIIYRPVFNYAVAKAIFKALKGVWVGWGKLDRTATVAQGLTEGRRG